VSEDALFEAFWPDRGPDAARRSLQVTVSSARAVLDPPGADRSVLAASDRTYRLDLGARDVVDAEEFEAAASAALAATGAGQAAMLQAAAARWRGEPLPEDRYEGWATLWRESLADLHGRVLGSLADACSTAGDQAGAVDAGRRLVDLDPLNEDAQRRLMLAYARSGRRGHALRQYLACRRALVDQLGIEPAEETTALQRRVLAGEAV
jgi:DNA-binding SARP family transcriptional activator